MKLPILKLTIPTILLCFAGSSFADTAPASASAKANPAITTDLSQQVQAKLKSDKRLDDASIQTDVAADGSILLRGTVDNMEQSQIAEQLASTVTGVGKVKNELQVPRGE